MIMLQFARDGSRRNLLNYSNPPSPIGRRSGSRRGDARRDDRLRVSISITRASERKSNAYARGNNAWHSRRTRNAKQLRFAVCNLRRLLALGVTNPLEMSRIERF